MINVQRSGPSTGMPTKTEQADLLQTMFGRNGESPLPIVAPSSPSDAFAFVLKHQGQSYEYAMKVGGYGLEYEITTDTEEEE